MGRRIAVVALWMAVVASALAVPAPAPSNEEHSQHEPQAAVQQKGECDDALLFFWSIQPGSRYSDNDVKRASRSGARACK